MSNEDKVRNFTSLIEEMHHRIEPLKKETLVIEREVGFENEELARLSVGIIRQLDSLQNSYLEQILSERDDDSTQEILKEFEEAFYNAVLDYRNALVALL